MIKKFFIHLSDKNSKYVQNLVPNFVAKNSKFQNSNKMTDFFCKFVICQNMKKKLGPPIYCRDTFRDMLK